jgi:2-polyprenyl-3-methyl-5-hydroxy-6-metoxy-1,4-benzoquinol methylase
MAEQYDEIAERFIKIKSSFIIKRHYHLTVYTLQRLLGDISGKSVLDLACGEGLYTRQLKQMGASRVVGVDISESMVRSAREQEAKTPLGIEYIRSSVQDLGKIGEFDVVIAVFLLHYAPTKEQLLKICQTVYDNLKPEQRFITVSNDFEVKGFEYPSSEGFKKYGYGFTPSSVPLQEGSVITITLAGGGEEVHYNGYYSP